VLLLGKRLGKFRFSALEARRGSTFKIYPRYHHLLAAGAEQGSF
jgi:hypothetical protein